jgi:hypothetical protein
MTAWQWFVAHWGYIAATSVVVLKWIYNAWTPGVSFPNFVRNFIGEIVQESPESSVQRKLESRQLKIQDGQVVDAKQ